MLYMQGASGELLNRIKFCIERIGGKRALAHACGFSEAQVYRYMSGTSVVPSDRLLAIARAAGVDPGWLLAGTGSPEAQPTTPQRPPFRPQLLDRLTEEFAGILLEYERTFSPRLRAHALTFMYDALRLEEVRRNRLIAPTHADMLDYMNFLCELRTDGMVTGLANAMNILEFSDKQLETYDATQLVGLVARAYAYFYNSAAGQAYFDRATHQIPPVLQQRWLEVLALLKEALPRPWAILDLGCGNGRELGFLWQHDPSLRVAGIELSSYGVQLAENLSQSHKLPPNCIQQGNVCFLPFRAGEFSLVNCRSVLGCLPWLESTDAGMPAAFAEVRRVLCPGGLFVVQTVRGKGRNYLPFLQFMEEDDLRELGRRNGLRMVSSRPHQPLLSGTSTFYDCSRSHDEALFAIFEAV